MNSLNIQLFPSALLAMYYSLEGYLYTYVVFLFLQFIKYNVHTASYVRMYVYSFYLVRDVTIVLPYVHSNIISTEQSRYSYICMYVHTYILVLTN